MRNPPWIVTAVGPALAELARIYPAIPLPTDPLDLNNLEIGCQTVGCAYELTPEVILKFSFSAAEAEWADLIRRRPTVGMARIYAMHEFEIPLTRWKGHESDRMWAIWREKVDEANRFDELVPMGFAQEDALQVYEEWAVKMGRVPSSPLPQRSRRKIHEDVRHAMSVLHPLEDLADLKEAIEEDVFGTFGKTREVFKELALAWLTEVRRYIPDLADVATGILWHGARGAWIGDAHADNVGISRFSGSWVLYDGMVI